MTGVELIAAERRRQVEKEGWTAEHDDEHEDESLALAAVCYAAPRPVYVMTEYDGEFRFTDPWPESWDSAYDKRWCSESNEVLFGEENVPLDQRIRQLAKAGALLAAEIDRLQRAYSEGAI